MKRAFATLGVVGLALLSVTAPAAADDDDEVYICHATSSVSNPYVPIRINNNGLNGHDLETHDVIPPNRFLPAGLNWNTAGMAIYATYCAPGTTPPVEEEEKPPVEEENPPVEEEDTVVDPPAVVVADPPAVVPAAVVPPVVAAPVPKAAPAKAPAAAAAPVSRGTNQGYNAQTAAGGNGDGVPTWLGGLGALLMVGLAVAARRRTRTE